MTSLIFPCDGKIVAWVRGLRKGGIGPCIFGARIRLGFEDNEGTRGVGRMREREVDCADRRLVCNRSRAVVQQQSGPSRSEPHDFDVAPTAAGADPGAERLVEGLFSREAGGQRGAGVRVSQAILDFAWAEQPQQAALAVAGQKAMEAGNRNEVQPGTEDHVREYRTLVTAAAIAAR